MKAAPAVLYDANVLYPHFLQDFLILLVRTGALRARWIEAIQDESIRSLRANRPDLSRDKPLALKDLPDFRVSGYKHQIEALNLSDPDDWHVLAAATEANMSAGLDHGRNLQWAANQALLVLTG